MITLNHHSVENKKQTGKSEPVCFDKSIVVEFVGPTGAGKTTNCHCFSELLKKENVNAYVFSDLKKYFYGLPILYRVGIYSKALAFYVTDLLYYTVTLATHGIYSFNSVYRYIKLCVFNTALQQFLEKQKPGVLLLDQWSIQGLWSATIFKRTSYRTLQNKLKRFYFKTDYVLYFDIDEETASERIQSRITRLSRFDRMTKENRLRELKRYNDYLYRLYENSSCKKKYKFSTGVSPSYNAEVFLRELKH